jgi:autoinducer-2 kinase
MLEGIGFYCGMSMRWFRDAFCPDLAAAAAARGVDPYVVMEEVAAAVAPGSNGVIAIMSNVMNAHRWVHASPSFLQFDLGRPESGRAACIRAIEEAAAYVSRGHRDIIRELTGTPSTRTVFTGGAAKGTLWPQILADVLGTPVDVPEVTESSALGAAICAGTGIGIFGSLEEPLGELVRIARSYTPSAEAVSAYDQHYEHWTRVYPQVLGLSEQGLLNPLWRAAGA